MTKMYDPPSGWMYGFPKEYKPKLLKDGQMEPLTETLRRDGYPEKMLNDGVRWCRFWGEGE